MRVSSSSLWINILTIIIIIDSAAFVICFLILSLQVGKWLIMFVVLAYIINSISIIVFIRFIPAWTPGCAWPAVSVKAMCSSNLRSPVQESRSGGERQVVLLFEDASVYLGS